jgi:superfamily II DNA/RNA helicase
MTESSQTPPTTNFSQLGLSSDLCQTLAELGYEQPTQIQEQSIPLFLQERDILGIAQTGTGKPQRLRCR